jgi:hypothetical protein
MDLTREQTTARFVVLLADPQGTGLQKLNRNYVVIPFGGDGQLTAVTGG